MAGPPSPGRALRPDVAIVDVSMPGMKGAETTEHLKRVSPDLKVLALTVHEDKGYLQLLLQAGASGYALKRAASEELIHAIRVVASGGVYLDPFLAGKVVGRLVRKPSSREEIQVEPLSDARPTSSNASPGGTASRRSPPSSRSASGRSRPTSPAPSKNSASAAGPTDSARDPAGMAPGAMTSHAAAGLPRHDRVRDFHDRARGSHR